MPLSSASLAAMHQAIRAWYDAHGRHDLPWRRTNDAYRIYVSEVMLQQTQVKTVLERYYEPFLTRFPTLESLAEASLEEVLQAWEGLGYYRRAKYLHRCATVLSEQAAKEGTAARLPETLEALQALPGIGKNTAHAILAFAYRKPVPVMEANVKRILRRFRAQAKLSDSALWQVAYALVDTHHPFDYNQAMMDIGALVCTPKTPRCDLCPLGDHCLGKSDPTRYDTATKRTVPTKEHDIAVCVRDGAVLLVRNEGEFLHGLWSFPTTEDTRDSEYLGLVAHAYSHFKLRCRVYRTKHCTAQGEWVPLDAVQTKPLSGVDRKIWRLFTQTYGSRYA